MRATTSSRRGPGRDRGRRRRGGGEAGHSPGFTLIELLVVMALLVILTGLAMPSFLDLAATSRLRAGARGVLQHCRYARDLAVRRQTHTRVELDTEEGAHRVLMLEPGEDGEELSWSEQTGTLGQPRRLPEGVEFDRLISSDPEGLPQVTFTPDGRGEDWLVSLHDRDERRLAVQVQGTTGTCRVIAPEDGEEFEALVGEGEVLP